MIRSAASKVMWVGRATVFLIGLAVILAAIFGLASTALGANGKPFLLGRENVASQVSRLVKNGAGPALKLVVQDGQSPLAVNLWEYIWLSVARSTNGCPPQRIEEHRAEAAALQAYHDQMSALFWSRAARCELWPAPPFSKS